MVQLIWTPGHSGFQINERVDSYARNAAFSGVIVAFEFTPDEALRHIKTSKEAIVGRARPSTHFLLMSVK